MKNLIIDNTTESIYGFIDEIIKQFKEWFEQAEDECDKEILKDAIEEATRLCEQEDMSIYECTYNPMGAYAFYKLKRA